jgi:hypothetical protein
MSHNNGNSMTAETLSVVKNKQTNKQQKKPKSLASLLGQTCRRISLLLSDQSILTMQNDYCICPRDEEENILTLCSSTGVGDMISFISCFIFLRVTDFLPTSEGRVLLRVVWL